MNNLEKKHSFDENQKQQVFLGFVFAILSYLLISTIFFFRSAHKLTPFFGSLFYENQLLYQTTLEKLSFAKLPLFFTNYSFFQSSLVSFFQRTFSSEFIAIVLFVFSASFAFYLLKLKKQTDGRTIFTLLFTLFSPAILMQFFSFTPAIFVIPLLLLLYFSLEKQLGGVSVFLFLFLSLLSIESAFLSYLLIWYFAKKRALNFLFLIQSIIGVILIALHMGSHSFSFAGKLPFFETNLLFGYSLYLFGIGVIGFMLIWTKRKKALHLTSLAVVLLSFFQQSFIPYAAIILAYYGSICIEKLYDIDWQESVFKIASLLLIYGLIVCGFIFFIQGALVANPGELETAFYDELSDIILVPGIETTILTLPRQQPYVSYFTNITTVVAHNNSFYHITDLQECLSILSDQHVEYILVDKLMREGEIWQLETDGLLLLLTNDVVFQEVLMSEHATVYWVNYRGVEQTQ